MKPGRAVRAPRRKIASSEVGATDVADTVVTVGIGTSGTGTLEAGARVNRSAEPREILVVIPARNEEDRLAGCLAAISVAIQHLPAAAPDVRVVVVLDSCTDGTAAHLASATWARGIECEVGMVGAARALGIDTGLPTEGWSWIACTDADTLVPPDWLCTQLAAARSGVDLLLGTVRPDALDLASTVLQRWLGRHQNTDGHPHIHGANMGIRSDIYRAAGGFAAVAEHEDVLLVERVQDLGGVVLSTGASPVLTSGRTVGRTPGGMAGYLRALAGAAPSSGSTVSTGAAGVFKNDHRALGPGSAT